APCAPVDGLRSAARVRSLARAPAGEQVDAVAELPRLSEPQRPGSARLAEEALPGADDDRVDEQAQLVDEVVLDQRPHELRAAVHDDVPFVPALQRLDL